jgi:hypothetical protein
VFPLSDLVALAIYMGVFCSDMSVSSITGLYFPFYPCRGALIPIKSVRN